MESFNVSNKIWKFVAWLIPIGIAIFSVWYSNKGKTTAIEVVQVSSIELTRPLNVKSIKAKYYFRDTIRVNHLWQTTYIIRNIGDNTIFGDGFTNKTIRGNCIPLNFEKGNILWIRTDTCDNDIVIENSSLVISQWKHNEYIKIVVFSDGATAPVLKINERDIQDAEIVYSEYSPEEQYKNKKWIDMIIPQGAVSILRWFVVFTQLAILLLISAACVQSIKEQTSRLQKIILSCVLVVIIVFSLLPILWLF